MMLNDDVQGFVEDPTESERFGFARNGDNYVCPFQCDLCQFRNVHMRDPEANMLDDATMCCIRRATLDAFWARAEGTVRANLSSLRNMHESAQANFGLHELLPAMGPFPLKDTFGMGSAIVMLKHSLDPGRYGDHITFSTFRKYRSSFSNVWGASVQTLQDSIMARATAKMYTSTCPTNGLWFERFMGGVHSRMGDDHRPDAAISSCVMKLLLKYVEEDLLRTPAGARRKFLVRAGLFFGVSFLGALRGEEVPRIVRKEFIALNKVSLERASLPHVVIPLYGRFKNESNVPRCHVMNVSCETKSGINITRWVRLAMASEGESRNMFLFSDSDGRREKGGVYEDYLFSLLERIQREHPEHIPASIDVREAFGISRSFRRGATSIAQNAPRSECDEGDVDRNNRWRLVDRARMKQASMKMQQLYTDTLLTLRADLRFSSCL